MLSEFRSFIIRGNMVDLAVGIVIGAAFTTVVNSFVNDLLMPPIGLLLANGVFAVVTWAVSEEAFMTWGWRIPFLSSALLIGVGLYIRMGLTESPLFEKMERQGKQGHAPLLEVLRHHKKSVGLALGSRIGSDIAFYVFTLFLLVYLPQQLQLPKSLGLQAVLVGAVAQHAHIVSNGAQINAEASGIGHLRIYDLRFWIFDWGLEAAR